MKFIKIISLFLLISLLGCAFISCDQGDGNTDYNLPEREVYTVNVSFQIKNAAGLTVMEAKNYEYKGHAVPTMLNVLQRFFSVDEEWTFKVDKNNMVTQIGSLKTRTGDYFGVVTNVSGKLPENTTDFSMENIKKNISLKEKSAINLSMSDIKKNIDENALMSNVYLIDGAEFTVILVSGE